MYSPHCICRNHFPAVLVGTYYISRCIGWNLFSDVFVGTFSRWIGWNPLSVVLIGTNVPPFWLELFPAKYFSLYWLKSISRRIGWNQFLVILFFWLYLLEPIFRCIDWNQLPAVSVGTNFMPLYLL